MTKHHWSRACKGLPLGGKVIRVSTTPKWRPKRVILAMGLSLGAAIAPAQDATNFSGQAGQTVTGNIPVEIDIPPTTITAGSGSVNPANLNSITYTFQIPPTARPGDVFTDAVTITQDFGGGETEVITVPVTIAVAAPPPPTTEQIIQTLAADSATQPQRAVAGVVGTVCPQGIASEALQSDCDALIGGAFAGDPGVAGALGQVTPDEASAPVDMSLASINTQAQNIAARLAALRAGATGIAIGGLGFTKDERWLTGEMTDLLKSKGKRGGAASADASSLGRLGIFINGAVDSGNKDTTDNEAGFDFDSWGITAGADYRINDRFIVGGALGYVNLDTDFDNNGGDLGADSYNLTLYGTYYQSDQFYLDGSLSYGWNDYDQDRRIRYALLTQNRVVNQKASSSYDGEQWSATLGGGYDFSSGALTYGPVGRLQYISADVDGYREKISNPTAPGAGWPLVIDDQDYESTTLSLGGQVSYAISQSWGVLLPQLRLEWIHEFDDDTRLIKGQFVGDPSRDTFAFSTDEPDQDYFTLGVGASAAFAQGRSAYFYYERLLGYKDLTDNTFNLGVRLEF